MTEQPFRPRLESREEGPRFGSTFVADAIQDCRDAEVEKASNNLAANIFLHFTIQDCRDAEVEKAPLGLYRTEVTRIETEPWYNVLTDEFEPMAGEKTVRVARVSDMGAEVALKLSEQGVDVEIRGDGLVIVRTWYPEKYLPVTAPQTI